ncbi:MAG: FKBP-type peptidyl-prolyl cis-trans isomerase [Bacteroidetes bacterium]|nr:FKBP-type peptidyl-prolyl cis-trans isomerase [Bacteroidota bacterium]
MKIEEEALVAITYTLRNGSAEGEIIEVCEASRPLEFLYDSGMMLPAFEKHLTGLEAGAAFEFTLTPEEAYGEFTPEAIVPVNKDIFAGHDDMLVIGSIVPMRDAQGNPLNGRILTIDNDKNTVTIDFNHPMAGKPLHFVGKVENVRAVTEEDIQKIFGGCGCSGSSCDSGDCNDSSNCESGCCN